MVRYEFSTNRILKNEDPISGIIDYMDSYLNLKPTDCVLYSENGHPFPMHKVSTYISGVGTFYNLVRTSKLGLD